MDENRMIPNGFAGKILWVDLGRKKFWEEHIPQQVYQKFLSGSGLGAYILYRDMPPGADPLGPENMLGFVSGLLTGTGALFAGRWMVVSKSPLTGTWGESNCGGNFSPAIKRCGYDGIFFKGKSVRPVCVMIEESEVRFLDAKSLWGLDAVETQETLRASYGKQYSIACIGQAGEKLSLISGIVNDGARIAARMGLGAVMGSKNLKAVLISGKIRTNASNSDAINRLNQNVTRWVKKQPLLPSGRILHYAGVLMRILPFQFALDGWLYKLLLKKWGTVGFNQIAIEMGDAPIKNWKGSYQDFKSARSKSIDPDQLIRHEKKKYHCTACPLGCGGLLGGDDPLKANHKPEYETVMAWSGLLLNEDTESIFEINDLLNRAGMDSMSAGATVAFAMECYEQGLLSDVDLDGIKLEWGSSQAVIELLKKMIHREGIGASLADGSLAAAKNLGRKSQNFAMQAGGLELAFHDPRYDPGLALHAVVEPEPGKHVRGAWQFYEMFKLWKVIPSLPRPKLFYKKSEKYARPKIKAKIAAANSCFTHFLDACGVCLFGAFLGVHRMRVFEYVNAVTGWNGSPQEMMAIGGRIQTLKLLFNLREGIQRNHAINSRLLGVPPLKSGSARGRQVLLEKMIEAYWQESGWDEQTGLPVKKMLQDLGEVFPREKLFKGEMK